MSVRREARELNLVALNRRAASLGQAVAVTNPALDVVASGYLRRWSRDAIEVALAPGEGVATLDARTHVVWTRRVPG